jgi:hypothetical protein
MTLQSKSVVAGSGKIGNFKTPKALLNKALKKRVEILNGNLKLNFRNLTRG